MIPTIPKNLIVRELKEVKTILKKLDKTVSEFILEPRGIFAVENTTSVVRCEFLRLLPYPVLFNVDKWHEFIDKKKMKDLQELVYSDTLGPNENQRGIVIIFEEEIIPNVKDTHTFELIEVIDPFARIKNKDKLELLKNFLIYEPSIDWKPNEEVKDILTNTPMPYIYKGFALMKSVAPVIVKATEVFEPEYEPPDDLLPKHHQGKKMLILKFKTKKIETFVILVTANKLMHLRFMSKKRW